MASRSMGRMIICTAAGLAIAVLGSTRIAPAAEFDDFISPVSNPVNFEDPRSNTEIRPIYVYHNLPNTFPASGTIGGGDVHIVAVQARIAVTDRFSFIATKDGYIWLRPEEDVRVLGEDVVTKKNGFANLAAGAKYALYYDPAQRAMATLGLRYEIPLGDKGVLQGKVFKFNNAAADVSTRGGGVMNPFLSGLWGIDQFHLMAYTGGRIALNDADSSFFDLSLHADYQIGNLYPLIEMNWVQVVNGGDRLQPVTDALGIKFKQEGFDFFNLGAPDAEGSGVVTLAFGARYRILDGLDLLGKTGGLDLGSAFETPLTNPGDTFGWRVTTDLVLWLR